MIKVYPYAPYHYEVSGRREVKAASELMRGLDDLIRRRLSGEAYLSAQSYLRQRIALKYDVDIRAKTI